MSNLQHKYLTLEPPEQYNLLVVDDEEGILKAIKRSFNRTKYQVFTASSAKEGLKILEEHDFQVVLSDFRMPDVDGGTLVKTIKKSYPHIVSMIITGYADFEAAVDVMNSGAAYKFLSKPWNNQQLIDEVEVAFQEYQQRLNNTAKEQLTELYVKPERVRFDKTITGLLKEKTEFALASIIVSDISLYDQYWEQRGSHDLALDSVAKTIGLCLPKDCQMFAVDIDQILVIVPEEQCNEQLHSQLTLLDKALSLTAEQSDGAPEFHCYLAYALAPFEGMNIQQLLHSIRNTSGQDYRDSQLRGDKSHVVKIDATHVAEKKRKRIIQNSIQQAINTNQFSLYFQPKVRLEDGVVENAEVLMRWEHSSLGWVSPIEFISLSELDGQIEKIGSWLLDNSITQLIGLRKQYGESLNLSINVSPRQLKNSQIVDELRYLLTRTGLVPSSLELEITEGCVIEDLQQTGKVLWQLKELGVRIAIDDFGAGYSSFAYLTKLPVDVLKLDKILIDDLETNKDVINMLQSIIGLCKRMDIDVVAEGVENQRQVELLKELECDYIQGYVYSRPVTKTDFEKVLINQPFMLTK
ncbi:EAL domain-containing response regulator [Paraglaciecola arctica]|uniref:EAL domain-containing response regulator n=1 Tax=Paraglaciecola arctica TaxID=1128911 RepID=UPI001C06D742|nr:EAL domain-containing protein [Paraglaciecola arctica]MBU3003347.1 EAL domain-containing protein [Paraglaciecola arctica]